MGVDGDGPAVDLGPAFLDHYRELHRRLREALAGLERAALDRAPADGTNSIAVLVTHALGSELDWLHTA
ncbi:MAG: hypothetical protein ACRDF0_04820, partial [Candidatus Limnocylindria bacterium]